MELIKRVEAPFARLYWVPSKNLLFPSVTTVLGVKKDDSVDNLRKELGEEKFAAVSKRGANRGTVMHKFLENFLEHKKLYGVSDEECLKYTLKATDDEVTKEFTDEEITIGRNLFWNFWYDGFFQRIKKVVSTEKFVYSVKGRFGGTTDLVYEDLLDSLIFGDFKSSSREKTKEEIPKYLMQISAYMKSYQELTGREPVRGEILISKQSSENISQIEVTLQDRDMYYAMFQDLVSQWFALHEAELKEVLRGLGGAKPVALF